MPCRCDNQSCSTCACAKENMLCTPECHGQRDLDNVPCLNTEAGKKVKAMKIGDVRTALCANGLSPVGDKSELLKRLADHFRKQQSSSKASTDEANDKDQSNSSGSKIDPSRTELFKAISENEDDFSFVLSLSGKQVNDSSSKPDLRRSYLLLSSKVHPDKNMGSQEAIKAFQLVLNAYERLANPEKFLNEEEDEPSKKRQKTERFTRSNYGCFKTKIKCPQCKEVWGGPSLGLEDAAYNFFMSGLKQYVCHICSCQFGCMTALHFCPHCNKEFEYDPDDYHRNISCGNNRCKKEFGFWMFKVSERREKEVRLEVKQLHEQRLKRASQKNRRAKRAGNRTADDDASNEMRLQERLFIIELRDSCPRCGHELERGERSEEAKQHLDECNDKKKMKEYQNKLAQEKSERVLKESSKSTEEEILAFKQWELNGRQVGQLWMLSDKMLQKQSDIFKLSNKGKRFELIKRLSEYLRTHAVLMITDGKFNQTEVKYDTCGIKNADDEDLPDNLHSLEREELQDLLASYNVKFNAKKDVKSDLIRKFEQARFKGSGQLMIGYDTSQKDNEED